MMNSRTRRRRAAAQDLEHDNGTAPSILEVLVSTLTDMVARSAILRAKHEIHEVVRWALLRLILGWLGAALVTGGIFLLLGAGVKGLEALHCPSWLSYLATGVLAILVAVVPLKGILWPRKEEVE